MLITVLLVLLSVIFLVYAYYRRYRFTLLDHYGRVVGGFHPEFLLGNVRQSGLLSGTPLYKVFQTYQKQFGDVFQYFLGPTHLTVFTHPDHAQYILSHRNIYESSQLSRDLFGVLFTNALTNLRGVTHRRHARVVLPMLKKNKALGFIDAITRHTNKQVGHWKAVLARSNDDQTVYPHLKRDMALLTLDLIGLIAFDIDFNVIQNILAREDTVHDIVKLASGSKEMSLGTAVGYLTHRFQQLISSGMPLTLVKLYTQYEPTWKRAKKTIRDHVLKCITNHKPQENEEPDTKMNVLKKLLSALPSENQTIEEDLSNHLTLDEVIDELTLVLFGAYDTTSTALSWLLSHITKHPEVQQKLKEELKRHLPDPSSELTAEIVNKLEYLDCVLKETLRFSPIVHAGGRMAMMDDVIDGVHVKKGQEIILAYYLYNVDPRIWKVDPTKFVPERFYGPDAPDANHHPYAFMTFGGGHHACAGQETARVMLKAITAIWMRTITFYDAPGNDDTPEGPTSCHPKALLVRFGFDG